MQCMNQSRSSYDYVDTVEFEIQLLPLYIDAQVAEVVHLSQTKPRTKK